MMMKLVFAQLAVADFSALGSCDSSTSPSPDEERMKNLFYIKVQVLLLSPCYT